jgi:hypothetical protein
MGFLEMFSGFPVLRAGFVAPAMRIFFCFFLEKRRSRASSCCLSWPRPILCEVSLGFIM